MEQPPREAIQAHLPPTVRVLEHEDIGYLLRDAYGDYYDMVIAFGAEAGAPRTTVLVLPEALKRDNAAAFLAELVHERAMADREEALRFIAAVDAAWPPPAAKEQG